MNERGITWEEVEKAIADGEQTPAKHGRIRFRLALDTEGVWMQRRFHGKLIDVYAVPEQDFWRVVTVIARYSFVD